MDDHEFLSPSDQAEIEQILEDLESPHLSAAVKAPWRCTWGWHQWSKWWSTDSGEVVDRGEQIGRFQDQQRVCLGCHRVQGREVRW